MTQEVRLSGTSGYSLLHSMRRSLSDGQPCAIGIAAAFVSTEGFRLMSTILSQCGSPECRLIAGVDNFVTHPGALVAAREAGWDVRIGRQAGGIFHPKIVVAGHGFSRKGVMRELCSVYVGSSNLTKGGLSSNLECGIVASAGDCLGSAAEAFAELWRAASPATDAYLRQYSAAFAECARARNVDELTALDVGDGSTVPSSPVELTRGAPPTLPAVGKAHAVAAWAGLQSFTGEYRFQVEFPKTAGEVIQQLIDGQDRPGGRVDIYCPEDGRTYVMQYRYYPHNGMFRLNIPNEVPGVEWARRRRDGLAVVELGPRGGAPLRLRVVRSHGDVRDVTGRSAVLGTWGKTHTRAYGWY